MIDKIRKHPHRDIVSRRLANIPLEFSFEGVEISVFWLNFGKSHEKPTDGWETSPQPMRVTLPFHRHSFYEMHLQLNGESIYQAKGASDCTLHAGEAVVIRAGQDHRCCSTMEDLHRLSLSFSLSSHSDSTIARELITCFTHNDIILLHDTQPLLPILYQILEEFANQSMGYEEATKALVFQLILALARLTQQEYIASEPVTNETRVDRRIGEIEAFINEHMSEMITPADIASSIHISTKQINRLLQNAFAMNTTEYIAQIKCAYAKHQLAFTDESITEIAAEIGYSSVFSFTKFFKRVEGMPPALFRRSRYKFKN